MRLEPLQSPATWAAETLIPGEGIVPIEGAALDELYGAAELLRHNPLPTEALEPADFDLPACGRLMQEVKAQVRDGIGFAIIDRLPVDDVPADIATQLYWLLMKLVSRPVAQKWDGTVIYDVHDTGQKDTLGSGVRSSKTNGGQGYHTDNAFNLPPDYVGLFCLQTAQSGGISGLVSFETVYNILLEEYFDLVPRLYQPFYFDRQLEHHPDEAVFSFKPVLQSEGQKIFAAYSPTLSERGYQLAGIEMDDTTQKVQEILKETPRRDGLGKSFQFERGQIQLVNNRRLGHRRSGFTDWDEPEKRRHLVRIWLRDQGRPFYQG